MKISVGTPSDGLTLEGEDLNKFYDTTVTFDDQVTEEVRRTLREPAAEFFVNKSGPDGTRSLLFAIGENLTSLVMTRPDQPQQVAAVTAESVPAIIARTVGLGPAPFIEERPHSMAMNDFEKLMTSPADALQIAGKRSFGRLFTRENWSLWYIQFSAPAPDGTVETDRFDVIGAKDHGWWFLDTEGRRVQSERTRAAIIWSMLCAGF